MTAFIDKVLDEDRHAPRKQRHTARRLYHRILTKFPDARVAQSTVRNQVRERKAEVLIEINTTPLIDVMLVLLIMLIIIIPSQTRAVKLDMPVGTPPPSTVVPEAVSIDIDCNGTVLGMGTRWRT